MAMGDHPHHLEIQNGESPHLDEQVPACAHFTIGGHAGFCKLRDVVHVAPITYSGMRYQNGRALAL